MGKLIIIRHGQSTWNAENRFTGWVDVDLSKKGIKEAEEAGKLIKELNMDFEVYFTSYLKRAIDTLEIILKILGKDKAYIKSHALNERHYGSFTAKIKSKIKEELGETEFLKYRRSWDVAPPSLNRGEKYSSHKDPLFKDLKHIPDTESLKDTANRVVSYFEKNIQIYLKQNKNIIISAHGNSLRALCKYLFNISNLKINELEIPTGNPLIIIFDKNLKIEKYYYLDKEREKKIIPNQ